MLWSKIGLNGKSLGRIPFGSYTMILFQHMNSTPHKEGGEKAGEKNSGTNNRGLDLLMEQ